MEYVVQVEIAYRSVVSVHADSIEEAKKGGIDKLKGEIRSSNPRIDSITIDTPRAYPKHKEIKT